jgi:hypothetical protein
LIGAIALRQDGKMANHRAMRTHLRITTVLAVSGGLLLSACSPSVEYQQGKGFYSEQFTQAQVQTLEKQGKVKTLAQFSAVRKSCLNFSESMTDRNMVIPAAQAGLRRWSGNAADQISAQEQWYDSTVGNIILGFLPLFLGCRNLEVSENVLQVTP